MPDKPLPIFIGAEAAHPEQKTLITTRTGEPYQPARVYYQVSNQKTVIGAFKKLRCMQFEPSLSSWRWLYDQEAKKLQFQISHHKIPKEHRPIVLGDFYFLSEHDLVLDIRSFDRVIQAILFFDKRINRRAAQVAKIRIVNKFFDANTQKDEPYLHPPFDFFFDRGDIDAPNPDELEKKMLDLAEEHEGEAAQRNAMLAYLEEKNKRPLPEIEEIPVYFYEDGISQLQMMLSMRTIEVMQHWRGNTSFRQYDIIRNMAESLMQQFSEFPEEFSEDESDDLQPPSVHHS